MQESYLLVYVARKFIKDFFAKRWACTRLGFWFAKNVPSLRSLAGFRE